MARHVIHNKYLSSRTRSQQKHHTDSKSHARFGLSHTELTDNE